MKIGIICPYSLDVSGGVQNHILDLSNNLINLGNEVRVLAPASSKTQIPDFVDSVGKALPIKYNGSVARLKFSPIAYTKLGKWITQNSFDVLHIHEPAAPSISLLGLFRTEGPVVVTFHMANDKSKALQLFKKPLNSLLEKITSKIAVSDFASNLQYETFGFEPKIIPNGVDTNFYKGAKPFEKLNKNKKILFIGRFSEDRKGFGYLLSAFLKIVEVIPDVELIVIGKGEVNDFSKYDLSKVRFLGEVSNSDKARWLKSADVYCAPNTGGESFGIILTEAMSASIPIIASDIPAFNSVLENGKNGTLFKNKSIDSLTIALIEFFEDQSENKTKVALKNVQKYDWKVVTREILEVYKNCVEKNNFEKVVITKNKIESNFISLDETQKKDK